jgi:transposase
MARAAAANDNAVRLSAKARDWREGRRLRALELLAEGYRASEVARLLGVTPGAVSQWSKRVRAGGVEALFKRKRQGRDARLSASQLTELRSVLAERAGSGVWTAREVAAIIREKWAIEYSRAHISRILKVLGVQAAARGSAPLAQVTSA